MASRKPAPRQIVGPLLRQLFAAEQEHAGDQHENRKQVSRRAEQQEREVREPGAGRTHAVRHGFVAAGHAERGIRRAVAQEREQQNQAQARQHPERRFAKPLDARARKTLRTRCWLWLYSSCAAVSRLNALIILITSATPSPRRGSPPSARRSRQRRAHSTDAGATRTAHDPEPRSTQRPGTPWPATARSSSTSSCCALEQSGCVGDGTTWQPCYLVARDEHGLAGALPLFIKYDSHGEFVFDWGWADAYERAGRNYYPKLVAAIPFTPATGRRLLLRDGHEHRCRDGVARRRPRARPTSSAPRRCTCCSRPSPNGQCSRRAGFLTRKGCQFHWANDGYGNFDEFLGRFSADKRKKAKRERRRVAEAGIVFEHLRGDEPTPADWDAIIEFYSRTFWRRGREPYLNREFFAAHRSDDAGEPARRARAPAGRADRDRNLLSQQHDAVRPLLGQQRRLPQPALRDVLLPRHRLLHPRRPRSGSSPARKASTRSRAASCRSRRGRAIGCATRSSIAPSARSWRARRATSTLTWTRSASTFRTGKPRPTTRVVDA